MTQLFKDHPKAEASNVCLFLGRDSHGERHIQSSQHQYRMGNTEWNSGFPELTARLRNDPVERQRELLRQQECPLPAPISFRVYPHLRRSYITEHVVAHFMLENEVYMNNVEPDPIPLPPANFIIQSIGLYKAYMSVACSQAIPEPVPVHPFDFHVLYGVDGIIAIIGRNILEHMLLLHRARFNHGALQGVSRGRLYFGRDAESRTF